MNTLKNLAITVLRLARAKSITLATAESCTGGLIASKLTTIAGASDVFECGFVTYSNVSKTKILGVNVSLIKKYGAVSKEVAKAMAKGALEHSDADIAVSVTGIAGPGGGSKTKPVGLVFIGIACRNKKAISLEVNEYHFTGTRLKIQQKTAYQALERVLYHIKKFTSQSLK